MTITLNVSDLIAWWYCITSIGMFAGVIAVSRAKR